MQENAETGSCQEVHARIKRALVIVPCQVKTSLQGLHCFPSNKRRGRLTFCNKRARIVTLLLRCRQTLDLGGRPHALLSLSLTKGLRYADEEVWARDSYVCIRVGLSRWQMRELVAVSGKYREGT